MKEARSRVEFLAKELGIPVVDQYKYLGAKINNHLSAKDAIREIQNSIMAIKNALYPALALNNLEYNIYTFRLFAIPKLLMIPTFLTGTSNI